MFLFHYFAFVILILILFEIITLGMSKLGSKYTILYVSVMVFH